MKALTTLDLSLAKWLLDTPSLSLISNKSFIADKSRLRSYKRSQLCFYIFWRRPDYIACPEMACQKIVGAFHSTKNSGLRYRNFRMPNRTIFSTRPDRSGFIPARAHAFPAKIYLTRVVFSLGQFWLDKVGKVRKYSENSPYWVERVKNARCFHQKKKQFSRQYDRKFTPSYTTSRDGITCLGKCRSQSHSA